MYPTPCWDLQEFRFVAASALKLFLSLCLETAEDYSGKYVLEGQLPWDAKQRDDELRKWPRCENPLSMGWFHLLERSKRDFSRYWLVIFQTISLLLPEPYCLDNCNFVIVWSQEYDSFSSIILKIPFASFFCVCFHTNFEMGQFNSDDH